MRPAPIDSNALANVVAPLGQATMLPGSAYTSEETLAWERNHFFAGSWVCVGRTRELKAQQAVRIGNVGLIVTDQGKAFANTCRHRAHELLPEGGCSDRAAIVCPYHGWAYSLDGSLRTAPRMEDDFRKEPFGLVELPAVDWHGWLFVNADGQAPGFDGHLGDLDRLIAPYQPAKLETKARHTYEVAANWKILAENYHECYHCPLIHPELCAVSPPTSGDNYDEPGMWVGGTMALRDHAQTMSLDGGSRGVMLPGVDPRVVHYLGIFPNLLVSAHPDYVMAHRLTPLAPDRTLVECSWLFDPSVVDGSYAVDFWDLTNRQDWAACESVQRGVSSPHFRPGPFAPNENAVHRWVSMIARGYLGPV